MNLYFFGHDYKYAAEQMMLTLFPGERPVYPEGDPAGDRAEIHWLEGERDLLCRLVTGGIEYVESVSVEPWTTQMERDRAVQRAVKLAFYRAALASGVKKPAWGALTGVKPGKLLARYLTEGRSAEDFRRDFDVSPDRAALCHRTTLATLAARDSLEARDIGLYVGIPFCPTRCVYCSFISNAVGKNAKLMEPYMKALLVEIARTGEGVKAAGQRVVSLYFGGGTPTTLTAEQLDTLCAALAEHFDLSALREYTVEAGRPDTITPEKMAVLKKWGVTRVSVNPQTMSDEVLDAIGRRHTAKDVTDALAIVRAAGDFEVNMDLIAGLPKDTYETFCETMEKVLALAPENITVHTLALKNGSRLAENPEVLPDGDTVGKMVDYASHVLEGAGYEPYYLYRQKYMSGGFENVGWAKPGTENLYNILMMEELCPILAMGAGGSTKITGADGSVRRRINPKYPKEYIERIMGDE